MKKDILFIIPSLKAGGAEKALVNLLNEFNYNEYNVDLFTMSKDGIFFDMLPKEVNIITSPENYSIFKENLFGALWKYISRLRFDLAFARIIFTVRNHFMKNKGKAEQYTWKFTKKAIGVLPKDYDAAIGYLEKTSNYLCVDCIEAKIKIGWIHNDYRKLNLDKEFDKYYFKKMNYVFTISEKCLKSLKSEFPEYKRKFRLMYNIISSTSIKKLSLEKIEDFKINDANLNILTVGRLSSQKNIQLAVNTCKIIKEKGINVRWYVIGEGEERENITNLIRDLKLENNFILLGLRSNPYKYMKEADIYVQPSIFEGKCIAIDEAKIMYKPIVVTNFNTAREQIADGINGLVSDINEKSLSDCIIKLMFDDKLKATVISNLKKEQFINKEEINKLYDVFN